MLNNCLQFHEHSRPDTTETGEVRQQSGGTCQPENAAAHAGTAEVW